MGVDEDDPEDDPEDDLARINAAIESLTAATLLDDMRRRQADGERAAAELAAAVAAVDVAAFPAAGWSRADDDGFVPLFALAVGRWAVGWWLDDRLDVSLIMGGLIVVIVIAGWLAAGRGAAGK